MLANFNTLHHSKSVNGWISKKSPTLIGLYSSIKVTMSTSDLCIDGKADAFLAINPGTLDDPTIWSYRDLQACLIASHVFFFSPFSWRFLRRVLKLGQMQLEKSWYPIWKNTTRSKEKKARRTARALPRRTSLRTCRWPNALLGLFKTLKTLWFSRLMLLRPLYLCWVRLWSHEVLFSRPVRSLSPIHRRLSFQAKVFVNKIAHGQF